MIIKCINVHLQESALLYTGDNLKQVLNFAGKHPNFNAWFKDFDDYQAHVIKHNMVFKFWCRGKEYRLMPGEYIIRTVTGLLVGLTEDGFKKAYALIDTNGECSI